MHWYCMYDHKTPETVTLDITTMEFVEKLLNSCLVLHYADNNIEKESRKGSRFAGVNKL